MAQEKKMKMIFTRGSKPVKVTIDEKPMQIPAGRSEWDEQFVNKLLMTRMASEIGVLTDEQVAKIKKEEKEVADAKVKAEADAKKKLADEKKAIAEALEKKKLMDVEIAKKKEADELALEIETLKVKIERDKETLKEAIAKEKKLSEKRPNPAD